MEKPEDPPVGLDHPAREGRQHGECIQQQALQPRGNQARDDWPLHPPQLATANKVSCLVLGRGKEGRRKEGRGGREEECGVGTKSSIDSGEL